MVCKHYNTHLYFKDVLYDKPVTNGEFLGQSHDSADKSVVFQLNGSNFQK